MWKAIAMDYHKYTTSFEYAKSDIDIVSVFYNWK